MKLLVAEDDPVMQMIWSEMVSCLDLPIELSIARDGNHALLHVISNRPDLIITDLEMPHTDGRTLIKLLSTNPLYADIPIIVVSGTQTDAYIKHPSVIAFLEKPFHFEEIRRLLKEQIQKSPEHITPA